MVLTIYQLLWIRGTHQLCCLDQILERQYSVQVGEYMGILTPNPTNIYVAFYPSNSMACFSNQNHFAVCCCQVNIFLHQSYELQRAKFFWLPSHLGLLLHVRTQSWKERENFRTLTKQKYTNCAMVSSQHTPYVSVIRGKFHTTQSGYPWLLGQYCMSGLKIEKKGRIGTLTNLKDTKSAMVSSQHSTHASQILNFSNHWLHIEVLSTEAHHQQTRVNRNTSEQIQNDLLNTEGPSTLICKQSTRSLSKLAPPCMFNWNSHESAPKKCQKSPCHLPSPPWTLVGDGSRQHKP
jgi:hypothetical protein